MSVEEDGEAILECDEDGRGRAAVGTVARVLSWALGAILERKAFQTNWVAIPAAGTGPASVLFD